ncbi:MAG: hypothetical protein V3U02_07150, partial [Calditrichia bacterium]
MTPFTLHGHHVYKGSVGEWKVFVPGVTQNTLEKQMDIYCCAEYIFNYRLYIKLGMQFAQLKL